MKKIKPTKKLNLNFDVLRTLQTKELRRVEGGIDDSVMHHCANEPSAASSGPVCCA